MTANLPVLAVNVGAPELIIIGLTLLPAVAVALVVIGVLILASRRNRPGPPVATGD